MKDGFQKPGDVGPAVEAGAHIADLIDTILKRKVSGVGLHLEAAR